MQELPVITSAIGYASSQPMLMGAASALNLFTTEEDFDNKLRAFTAVNRPDVQPKKELPAMSSDRIVKVFIADTNPNIPSDNRILYSGPEKFCDLTDQELFFEVPMLELLAKHNDYRKTVTNKSASEKFGRDVFLDPIRMKDLRMVVVTVAQF